MTDDGWVFADSCRQQEIQNLVDAESNLESSPHDRSMHEETNLIMESPGSELDDIRSESRQGSDPARDEAALPPTLETRKKKKKTDSASPAYKPLSQDNQSITVNQSREPIKSGSKRKFSPDEDGVLSDLVEEDDEFQFSRAGGSPQRKADPFDFMRQDCSPSKMPVSVKRGSANTGITKRKVLEPSTQHSSHINPHLAFC